MSLFLEIDLEDKRESHRAARRGGGGCVRGGELGDPEPEDEAAAALQGGGPLLRVTLGIFRLQCVL